MTAKGLVTSEITEMIYAPYNKTDKFGRCADWMSEDGARGDASSRDARREERRERRERERESKRKDGASGGGRGAVGGVETVFNFVADAGEEESFSLVDNTNARSSGGGGGRGGKSHRGQPWKERDPTQKSAPTTPPASTAAADEFLAQLSAAPQQETNSVDGTLIHGSEVPSTPPGSPTGASMCAPSCSNV